MVRNCCFYQESLLYQGIFWFSSIQKRRFKKMQNIHVRFWGKRILPFLTELLRIMLVVFLFGLLVYWFVFYFTTVLFEIFASIRRSRQHVNKTFCVHFSKGISFWKIITFSLGWSDYFTRSLGRDEHVTFLISWGKLIQT